MSESEFFPKILSNWNCWSYLLIGAMTMALLENLVAGNIYLVKIAASNEVGEGPFSNAVEFAVLPKETSESNQRPKRLDSGDSTSQ